MPAGNRRGVEAERVGEAAKAVLRMVGRAGVVGAEPLPDRGRQPGVEPGQDDGALRQPRDRRHEGARRAARAGRAGDDHRVRRRVERPGGGQRFGGGAHPALAGAGAGGGEIAFEQAEEAQAPLPVRRMLAGLDAGEGRGRDPLALELVEELGEAVGEVEDGRAGGEVRLGVGEGADQPRQFEPAAQLRHRRPEVERAERVGRELGHHPDPRQEPRRPGGEERRQRPRRPAGVDPDLDPRHRLGRLPGEPRLEPGDERAGEVDAGREREDPRAVGGREEPGHRASSASASAMPSGRPTSAQPPGCTIPRSRLSAMSASQTPLSE